MKANGMMTNGKSCVKILTVIQIVTQKGLKFKWGNYTYPSSTGS